MSLATVVSGWHLIAPLCPHWNWLGHRLAPAFLVLSPSLSAACTDADADTDTDTVLPGLTLLPPPRALFLVPQFSCGGRVWAVCFVFN